MKESMNAHCPGSVERTGHLLSRPDTSCQLAAGHAAHAAVSTPRTAASRRHLLRGLLGGGALMTLSACGFRLRRNASLPFRHLYTNLSPNGSIGLALRREVANSEGTTLVTDPQKADVRLIILQESPEREVVAYSSEGRAREYELRLRVRFRIANRQNDDLVPESEIVLRRDISNADNQLTARADEEAMLFKDMSTDMAHQLMWRLAALRSLEAP